jgi:NAD(P)H-dependent FMN reductase
VNPDPSSSFRAVAFSGSLRAGSSNTGLVHLAARLAPAELSVEVVDWVGQLPYYNPDLEEALPEVAARWRAAVEAADAVIIGMPEYNFGPSGLAKNAIDWLTRPLGTHALRGKVVAMLTSGGKGGGSMVQPGIGGIIGLLGNTVVEDPKVNIAAGGTRLAGDGTTDDAEIIDLVTQKLANVVAALQAPKA